MLGLVALVQTAQHKHRHGEQPETSIMSSLILQNKRNAACESGLLDVAEAVAAR
jgi:hypothetical protein